MQAAMKAWISLLLSATIRLSGTLSPDSQATDDVCAAWFCGISFVMCETRWELFYHHENGRALLSLLLVARINKTVFSSTNISVLYKLSADFTRKHGIYMISPPSYRPRSCRSTRYCNNSSDEKNVRYDAKTDGTSKLHVLECFLAPNVVLALSVVLVKKF